MPKEEKNEMGLLKEKIIYKIRGTFTDIIPEESWNTLVIKEIIEFHKHVLPHMVQEALKVHYKKLLTEELKKEEYLPGVWNEGKYEPGRAITQIIKESAPHLINALFGQVIQEAIMAMQINLQKKSGY